MKRIHFQETGANIYKWVLVIFFLASIPLVLDYLKIIEIADINTQIQLFILSLLPVLILFFFINGLGYKNFVHWNKLGMYLRIGSFFGGYRLDFKKIIKSELQGDNLVIYEKNDKKIIDLSQINKRDRKELLKIINEHIQA